MHRAGDRARGHDDGCPEAECLDALTGDEGARGQVDANGAGMGQQAPQVHAGVHRDAPPECPSLPGLRDGVLDDDDVGVAEGGGEPGGRRRRLIVRPRPVREHELVAGEAEAVMPVQTSAASGLTGTYTFTEQDGSSPTRCNLRQAGSKPSPDAESGSTVPGATSKSSVANSAVISSTTTVHSEESQSGHCNASQSPMCTRSNAPSGSRRPAEPGTRTETGQERVAAPATERITKANSFLRSCQWPLRTITPRWLTAGVLAATQLRARQAEDLRSQLRDLFSEGTRHVRCHAF